MTMTNPTKTDVQTGKKRKGIIRSSIQTKIAFWAGLCLALMSLILIAYSVITLRQSSIDSSTKEADAIAEAKASLIESEIDLPNSAAHTLAFSLGAIKNPGIPITLSREEANAMLRNVLLENPSFLGTYTLWEPNTFDGLDAQYVRAQAHDDTGRFIPYWVRGDDGIIHTEALAQYEQPGIGDWYILPRSTKKEVTIAPLFRKIQGQDVVIASFIVPIVQNDTFYGIAGVDAPIGFVQELVDSIDLYDGTANAVLFTQTGTLIAVRQKPELTNQAAKLIYEDFDKIQPQLSSAFTRLSSDGKYLQVFSPIDLNNSGNGEHWVMGLIIPFEKITAPATNAAIRQVVISTGLIAIVLVFLWFLAGQIVRPMRTLTAAAAAVSEGQWDVTVDVRSNDETAILASAFNAMTSELKNIFGTLEQRVAERTKALSSVAEVSTAASTILETDRLLQQVVDLSKERFGFYHAHIYLLNETRDALVLASGAGEIGRQMVAEGRSIPLDREQSLVARAAREKKGVTVNDVTQTPDFLPNPLLPDTHSELAVPMMVGEQVIGVFDVQSEVVGRFTDADIAVQTTLAAQIASAVQNARSYGETQAAQQLTRTVIDSTDDWIFIKDREHRYVLVNRGYSNSLHIPIDDFIGKDDLDLGFPEELVKGNPEKGIRGFWSDDNLVMETGEVRHYPDDPATIDGAVHIFDTLKIPLRDADGHVWAVLGFARDISERKHLEELTAQRAKQQEAINLITQRIQSEDTVEAALQVAARELGRALGNKRTVVALDPAALAGGQKSAVGE